MQLDAYAVRWEMVVSLAKEGKLQDALCSDRFESIVVGTTPWPSDSCVQYSEVAESYQSIRQSLPTATRTIADAVIPPLINMDFRPPNDLGMDTGGTLVLGSVSPSHVDGLLTSYAQLNYVDLDRAFDAMPAKRKSKLQICTSGASERGFTGYLRQWETALKYAHRCGAGIVLMTS